MLLFWYAVEWSPGGSALCGDQPLGHLPRPEDQVTRGRLPGCRRVHQVSPGNVCLSNYVFEQFKKCQT